MKAFVMLALVLVVSAVVVSKEVQYTSRRPAIVATILKVQRWTRARVVACIHMLKDPRNGIRINIVENKSHNAVVGGFLFLEA